MPIGMADIERSESFGGASLEVLGKNEGAARDARGTAECGDGENKERVVTAALDGNGDVGGGGDKSDEAASVRASNSALPTEDDEENSSDSNGESSVSGWALENIQKTPSTKGMANRLNYGDRRKGRKLQVRVHVYDLLDEVRKAFARWQLSGLRAPTAIRPMCCIDACARNARQN